MIGTTLSHYKITDELGRGGMGIVYKATDTKLDRTVAIKVLPSAALASDDDRERFYREAKAAAQLHHPNIASVFEIDEAVPSDAPHGTQPSPFIAMEYIAGGTLQDKVKEAPLPLADVLKITSQVAEALKAAHAKDIVHRDIKSANVMITGDGIAKVLDFGLAKTNQSTMLTRMGSTLGTVAYMSPEQARGQEVDGRTDLYSLGTMLYELVAGRLPFGGDYEQAVVYSILNEAPEPLTSLRTGVPMQLEWIVNKLLSKDAEYRYQTAADLLADLKSLDLSGSGQSRRSMPVMSAVEMPAVLEKQALPVWVFGAIIGALLIGVAAAWLMKPVVKPPPSTVFAFPLQLESQLARTGRRSIAISPNGEYIAYVTGEGIRLRRTNDLDTSTLLVNLEETSGAARELFFSWDSRWLAYEDDRNNRLMRVDLSGGSPSRLADLPGQLMGASSASNGDIFLGFDEDGIGRVARGSGTVEILAVPDSAGRRYFKPSLLPDGQTLLYTARHSTVTGEDTEIRLLDLESLEDRLIQSGGGFAQYVNTGHILFIENNTLYAIPFDDVSKVWPDNRVPMVENVFAGLSGNAHFDVSDEGTLVVAVDSDAAGEAYGRLLGWVSTDGQTESLTSELKIWAWPDLNLDGTRVVAEDIADASWDLWTMEVAEGTPIRLTSNGRSTNGVWSPDGIRIAHADANGFMLLRYLNDASRVDTLLHEFGRPTSWSNDGRVLFFEASRSPGDDSRLLKVLDLESGDTWQFPQTQDGEQDGNISPDGRWLAYEKISNGVQVYVLPFPSGGDPRLISGDFGHSPQWSADGKRIYYLGNGEINVSDFDPETGVAQAPTTLLLPPNAYTRGEFDVHPDGRILIPLEAAQSSADGTRGLGAVLKFVVHFDEELRNRAGNGQ